MKRETGRNTTAEGERIRRRRRRRRKKRHTSKRRTAIAEK
jgi:hypothetical protein